MLDHENSPATSSTHLTGHYYSPFRLNHVENPVSQGYGAGVCSRRRERWLEDEHHVLRDELGRSELKRSLLSDRDRERRRKKRRGREEGTKEGRGEIQRRDSITVLEQLQQQTH